MTKGVVILAFAKRGYVYAAYNLAFSIKYFNKDIPVHLLTDDTINQLDFNRRQYFDTIEHLPQGFYYTDKNIDPGKAKINIYDLLPYDENIFLDADAIAFQDIAPIFDEFENGYYFTKVFGTHKLSDGNEIPSMPWALAKDVWDKYSLTKDTILPGINTSIQLIKKCEQAKDLYYLANKLYSDPIPLRQLLNQWGGTQPDELYMGVALAKCGMTGEMKKDRMFFGHKISEMTDRQIQSKFELLSVYGGRNFTRTQYIELYDNRLINYHDNSGTGLQHIFKYNKAIVKDKHSGRSPVQFKAPVFIDESLPEKKISLSNLINGKIPISETSLIDASKLIRNYDAGNSRVIVSNWLNCSFIEFAGKRIFCYRMEPRPFCATTRLGICLLDKDFQPIESTNVLLNLHSDLKGFIKGFHVEDPRLFIYDNKLMLSYTDGYQMAQAEIDQDTLQAKDSFYIDKPNQLRTEKNWVFFEHEKTLYCVYDFNRHQIFKMHGSSWEKVYESDFSCGWHYGEIRGGTSPIRVGDKYITFFHSAINYVKKGVPGRQYFMGAYAFEASPPFTPISISKEPILAGEYISAGIPRLSNQIFVVFPGGIIKTDDGYMISFGYNDIQCRYINITEKFLSENMIDIKQKELV